MSFHLNPLPRCACGKPATVEVRNERNATFGRFCDGCGARKKRELEGGRSLDDRRRQFEQLYRWLFDRAAEMERA